LGQQVLLLLLLLLLPAALLVCRISREVISLIFQLLSSSSSRVRSSSL
jgi:hypothetical protein